MQRLFALMFVLLLAVAVSACGGPPATDATATTGTEDATATTETDDTTPTTEIEETEPTEAGGAATEEPTEAMMEEPTVEATEGAMMEEPTVEATEGAMMEDATPEATDAAMMEDATPEATEGAMAEDATPATDATAEAVGDTIADVAAQNPELTTLVTALQAANLEETLQDVGPFTVFAPTDDAFANLPAGTLEALLTDPTLLGDILAYHVTDSELLASDLVDTDSVVTLQGESISVQAEAGVVTLNDGAEVTQADIETTNGVVHIIDTVLLPPNVELPGN